MAHQAKLDRTVSIELPLRFVKQLNRCMARCTKRDSRPDAKFYLLAVAALANFDRLENYILADYAYTQAEDVDIAEYWYRKAEQQCQPKKVRK